MSQVIPTKGNLIHLKAKEALAKNGEVLLDRKKNILIQEVLTLVTDITEVRAKLQQTYKKAYQALQDANITLGIVSEIAKAIPIDQNLQVTYRPLMGVDLPVILYEKPNIRLSYGLRATNSKFDYAYKTFQDARDLTVELAKLESTLYRLANAIRQTKKRHNALKNVILPNLDKDIHWIKERLEAEDQEEFIRLKTIKNKQEKAKVNGKQI
ncbi:V-type ATP synthase subunit D [Acholeplasma laidlawii]|uniref:V-type ATP synthase subunit D n=1 Tax=Acholeplasma laidlawii TaxID=2148 RepID=A0A553IG11_ACHLA|nr:V-type ATP synthase subunit D [Acholeplasma laidlawii]NWH10753.1 V-type ATP synthase subunit D [Acholeplasma laidlawii]NWH12138.1 V-type ATP synthase subunit D [Acholeplasma laidlawii]NWH13524.1 V-type ATP synthase subunit D [Acholeplasma laidlawii]OAN17527.1 ATPase [Acholeplasma laidlawii]OED27251.1 ATPase [Acholeplasma laidlawii]